MPWRRDSAHEKETLESIKGKIDYMFCHTETQGVQTSPSTRHLHEGGNDLNTFKRFKRVYSGHIHYRQEKENFILVGNPYQMTRSDRGNQKGIYILDLSTGEHQFIQNKRSPIFIRYYINEILDIRMGEIATEITGNFVDIYIPSKVLGKYNINRFMDFLDGLAHNLEPKIYDDEIQLDLDDASISDFKGDFDLLKIGNSIELFSKIIRDQSLAKPDIYRASVNYESIDVNGQTASVKTIAIFESVKTPVTYTMVNRNNRWFITDIIIDNVSTAASYQRSFQSTIRKNGFSSLIDALRKRAERA
jgi:hypothetical protein